MNFSELTITACEKWLTDTYPTPSQFNKAHTMLHTLFQYALRQEWTDRNIVKLVQKRKVIETEIKALTLSETKALLRTSKLPKYKDCQAGLALMIWAGIRPQKLQRLKWQDIDLDENIIRITPTTSKTGGARHIEIPKALKAILGKLMKTKLQLESKETLASANIRHFRNNGGDAVVPRNWHRLWKSLRKDAGFSTWTQDILRHTYASYHAKNYKDLPRLQLNMGHSNLQLLRTRYINLHNITKHDAKSYFSIAC